MKGGGCERKSITMSVEGIFLMNHIVRFTWEHLSRDINSFITNCSTCSYSTTATILLKYFLYEQCCGKRFWIIHYQI